LLHGELKRESAFVLGVIVCIGIEKSYGQKLEIGRDKNAYHNVRSWCMTR